MARKKKGTEEYVAFLGRELNPPKERADVTSDDAYQTRRDDDFSVGAVLGTESGEEDRDVTAGGWAGTDDATSTAPSDLPLEEQRRLESLGHRAENEEPDTSTGRAYAGGLSPEEGGVTDIKATPVEGSHDWEHDPFIDEEKAR